MLRKKTKGNRFCVSKGSQYLDAKGSSHIKSCLHDAIIYAAQIIRGGLTYCNCIDSVHLEG